MIGIPPSEAGRAPRVWISSTEIPWEVYDAYLLHLDGPDPDLPPGVDALARPSKPYIMMDRGYGHQGYPAISVSLKAAREFCRWLSARTGRAFRLPTEEEWELAARAGSGDPADLGVAAWTQENSEGKTHPIAAKATNAWGFHDLLGNAAEWCTTSDGQGVVRGGSFRDKTAAVRCDARVLPSAAWNRSDPQIPKSVWWLADGGFVGFRIACDPDPSAPPKEKAR
jgi:formylglycine-generating enzyme required for sulfatase activity